MEILGFALFILISGVSLAAFFVLLGMFFQERIDRIQFLVQHRARRSFWVGLVNLFFFGSLTLGFWAIAANTSPIFIVPAFPLSVFLGVGVVFGLAGVVAMVGAKVFPDKNPYLRTAYAAGFVYLACLAPVIGWVLLSFTLVAIGLGAFMLSFSRQFTKWALEFGEKEAAWQETTIPQPPVQPAAQTPDPDVTLVRVEPTSAPPEPPQREA